MKEYSEKLIKTVIEKITNPWVFTFAISFVFYNWDSFYIFLFAKESVQYKIAYFNIGHDKNVTILLIFSSFIYINLMPYATTLILEINKGTYQFSEIFQIQISRINMYFERKKIRSEEKTFYTKHECEYNIFHSTINKKLSRENDSIAKKYYYLRHQILNSSDSVLDDLKDFILEKDSYIQSSDYCFCDEVPTSFTIGYESFSIDLTFQTSNDKQILFLFESDYEIIGYISNKQEIEDVSLEDVNVTDINYIKLETNKIVFIKNKICYAAILPIVVLKEKDSLGLLFKYIVQTDNTFSFPEGSDLPF